jgi:Subtilase family/Peptidase inhibitor I9
MRHILISSLALLTLIEASHAQGTQEQKLAPIYNKGNEKTVSGQYIVVLKRQASFSDRNAVIDKTKATGADVIATFESALRGFTVKASDAQLEKLRSFPEIEFIEADPIVHAEGIVTQSLPLSYEAGLDRVDQRLLMLDHKFIYSETGQGVNMYIIDTGIRATNVDFGGRVDTTASVDEIHDGKGTDDCNGHGTNVAGIAGSSTYGIAKQATLHAVRVLDCTGNGTGTQIINGIDWVMSNAVHPAVANMSLNTANGAPSASMDLAVQNAIASGVTFVVAAGNYGSDACNNSPARVPQAITVGNIEPTTDTRHSTAPEPSNYGSCLKLFAPGFNILSTGNASDTATSSYTGTSQATPFVAGAAALYLQYHNDSPAAVLNAILNAADVAGTPGWLGVQDAGTGSPNILHWGATSNGSHNGDPHVTTVGGIHYDFQGAGEFVAVRDGNKLEIQTRQAPVSSAPPPEDGYSGLRTCVSITTAVAARVNGHRVTFDPSADDPRDTSIPVIRIDGAKTGVDENGVDLPGGGRVQLGKDKQRLEIESSEGLISITYNWWPSQARWYINMSVDRTTGSEGLLGVLGADSWLPALPDGTSLGPKPSSLHQRYLELYDKFGNAWRVTSASSLFDYAPGQSTNTFTLAYWPPESPPCVAPGSPRVEPLPTEIAEKVCAGIRDDMQKANCIFDVSVTGERGFASAYANMRYCLLQ